jgi:hypothetical protein
MSLYQRLLEYPVLLRLNITELGEGARKLVKAVSTMFIMFLFTYLVFNVRGMSQLSLTVLLGIALIYAIRDLLRDDMISIVTRWLRRGRARWKIRLLMPYTKQLLAQKLVWLDYRRLGELPAEVAGHSAKWATSEERQIICYRSLLSLDKAALEQNEIQEHLNLDCEQLCQLIETPMNRIFLPEDEEHPFASIGSHLIEKQHDYNLLLVSTSPGEPPVAQRWRVRLGAKGIVQCESKKLTWPVDEGSARGWRGWRRLARGSRRRPG